MKPFQANILNAAVLVIMGLWGYFSSENPSVTALIPVIFGVLFLIATPPFKNDNKVVAHIIVLLTFLLVLMTIGKPMMSAISSGDSLRIFRSAAMVASGIFAMIIYIKNFIDVRKARKAEEAK